MHFDWLKYIVPHNLTNEINGYDGGMLLVCEVTEMLAEEWNKESWWALFDIWSLVCFKLTQVQFSLAANQLITLWNLIALFIHQIAEKIKEFYELVLSYCVYKELSCIGGDFVLVKVFTYPKVKFSEVKNFLDCSNASVNKLRMPSCAISLCSLWK